MPHWISLAWLAVWVSSSHWIAQLDVLLLLSSGERRGQQELQPEWEELAVASVHVMRVCPVKHSTVG